MSRPSVRPTSRLEVVTSALREQKLQDEQQVLEALVASATRGQSQPEVWALLHEAAARDERLAELAFAYERLVQDRKFKFLPTGVQCEILMHAATFLADVLGDQAVAISFLEQVLAIAPTHAEAFGKIEALLVATQNGLKLADLYANVATHRDKAEQLELLWRAAEITDGFSEEQERAIRIYQQLYRLAPDDERVRRTLEARYRQAGRFRDLARLLDQSLAANPKEEEAHALRERLVELYASELSEPERALPHAEEILKANPSHEGARRAAHRMLSHKSLVARASAALADAYERLGTYPEACALLAIHLENVRGPKKAEVQKRLAILKQDKLDDAAGAFTLLESVIAVDPADADARLRYRQLAGTLGRSQDAARLLSRAVTGVRDVPLKAELLVEVGQIYLQAGDAKRARTAFTGAIETKEPAVVLTAARQLATIYADASEPKLLAEMLDLLSHIEPEAQDRLVCAERLARLAESELGDRARAVTAWKGLLGTSLHRQALESLQGLYEASGAEKELIGILEERAALEDERTLAQKLAIRACELRSRHMSNRPAAIDGWVDYVRVYGPSREANAHLIPLLEQERRWDVLVAALEQDVALASGAEKIALLLKLAQVRMNQLHDLPGALDAYRQIWTIDPKEPNTRQALEKMLAMPEGRLGAASLLEPCYRAEGAIAQLVRTLEARAEAATEPLVQLAALDEATTLVERDLSDSKRAFDIAGRALTIAVQSARQAAPSILERFERIAVASGDVVRHAELLRQALGEARIDDAVLCDLAGRAGEALVRAGALTDALAVFRRALEFDPSSAELLAQVDALLQGTGRPEERLALYRAALDQAQAPDRRRELLHAIGHLQSRELGQPAAAAETFRLVLQENPDDPAARSGLLDAYEAAGDWPALYRELAAALESVSGEKRAEISLKMGEVAYKQGDTASALSHYRDLLESGYATERVLGALEGLAQVSGDAETLALVLEKKAATTTDPKELCACLEQLGEVLSERLERREQGADAWKRAAAIAEQQLSDEERARLLLDRALVSNAADRKAALELRRLCIRAAIWDRLPFVYETLVKTAGDDGKAVEHLLDFEPYVVRSQGIETWLKLARIPVDQGASGQELSFCRARVLAADPNRSDEAASAFRALLESAPMDPQPVVQAFEAFLNAAPQEGLRREDRRYLFRWNADHAPDAQRVAALATWAAAEERVFGDAQAAVAVYRSIVALEPEHSDALEALVRLLLSLDDRDGALSALLCLRDHSEGASRRERDLQIAELLAGGDDRASEALSHVAPLLDANPADIEALEVAYRLLGYPSSAVAASAVLEKAAAAIEDKEQSRAILTRLLSTPRTRELESARKRWFGALLDQVGADPGSALTMALRGVLELPEDSELWARAEKLGRSVGRPSEVAQAYAEVLRQPLAADLASDLGRRAVDYQEEWFDDPQAVISLLRRVVELAPEATWARDRLKLAYSATERWTDLFGLYDEAIARASSDASRAELLAEAGQTAKDFANDPDRAIDYFEKLLLCRKGDKWVMQLLERLYERQGRTEPLISLLGSQLLGLEGELAQKLRARIATLLLTQRADLAGTFKLVEEMLAIEPGRAEAYALLEQIVFGPELKTDKGADGSLAPGSLSPGSLSPGSLSPGSLSPGSLSPGSLSPSSLSPGSLPPGSPSPLCGSVPPEDVQSSSPTIPVNSEGTLSHAADPGAAPIGSTASAAPPADLAASSRTERGTNGSRSARRRKEREPRLRDRAATMLKDRYTEQGRLVDLSRVLEVELASFTQPKELARGHKELLKLRLEGLHDDAGAFEHAAALVTLEPRVPDHRKLVLELADRLGWHERLVEVLVSTADHCADAPLVVRLLADAASVCRDKLSDSARAIDLYTATLNLSPKDHSFALATARSLDELLAATPRYVDRCWALERILALEEEPAACREALATLSSLALERLSDPDRATSAWRAHIRKHPTDEEAEEGLSGVLRKAERWQELVELLEQRSNRRGDSAEAKVDATEVATLYARELKAPERAVDTWMRIRKTWGPGADSFGPLFELLESQRRWEELASLIVDEATRAIDPAEPELAAERLSEIRKLAERAIRNTERATAHRICKTLWEVGRTVPAASFSQDPASTSARHWSEATFWSLDQLVRMAVDAGEHATATGLLLEGASLTLDATRSRQMRQKAASGILSRLGDAPRAIGIFEQLLEENDSDPVADAVVPELARLYAESGAWQKLATLWERQAARHVQHGNARMGGDLWCKAADLREKKLADVQHAIADCLEGASCGSHTAVRELARLYTFLGEHAKAAEVLERVCEQASLDTIAQDTIALANSYLEAGDRDRARQRLEHGVATLGQPSLVRARLRELYQEERNWDKLSNLLRVEADDAGDRSVRLALLRQVAALDIEQRGDPASAVGSLEQALKLDPEDSGIVLTLARALTEIKRHEDASAVLREGLSQYGARKPKERALLHFELAKVSLLLGERAVALAELAAASKIDPVHPAILYALGRLAFEEGQLDRAGKTFRALLLVLGGASPLADVPVTRAEVLLELSAIAETQQDAARAREFQDSALHVASENEREAAGLERVLRQRNNYDLLATSLWSRLEASQQADTRGALLDQIAAIHGEHIGLGDDIKSRLRAEAERLLTDLERRPEAPTQAWSGLDAVYGRLGDLERQAQVLKRRIELAAQTDASVSDPEPWYRLARLRFADPDTHAEGADLVARAIAIRLDPDRAEEVLRYALECGNRSERVLGMYEKVTRSAGHEPALLDALVRLCDLDMATGEQVREAVTLSRRLGRDEQAERFLERAVASGVEFDKAGQVWAKTALADLCERRGELGRAADLREQAAAEADPVERTRLLLSVAAMAKGTLGDLARAGRIYASLRERDPRDRTLWAPLLDVYRQLGDSERLVALISEALPLVESGSERSALRLEQITIMLKSPERNAKAIELLRELLEDDPGHAQAAFLLSGLLEQSGQFEELSSLLQVQLDFAKDRADVASVVSMSMRLGSLLEQHSKGQDALDVYRTVLDWDPESKEALEAIVRIAEAGGDGYEIAYALEGFLRTERGERAEALALRLLSLRREQEDVEGADRAIELGLRAHPASPELRRELLSRAREQGRLAEFAHVFEEVFARSPGDREILSALLDACRQAGRYEPALNAVTRALENTPEDANLYLERARVNEELGRFEEAALDLERVFRLRGPEFQGEFTSMLARLGERIGSSADRTIKLRLAEAQCATGQSETGRMHLAELLKRDPKDRDALRALARVEEQEEKWDAASTSLRRLLPLEEGEALVDVAGKLAVACERAGRPGDARAGLERALKAAPGNLALRKRLESIYENGGAHRELAEFVLEDAARQGDVAGRFALLLRAGDLLCSAEGDPERAVKVLEEARSLRPEDEDAVLLLGRAYAAAGRVAEAVRLFEDSFSARVGAHSSKAGAMYRELGRIRLREGDRLAAVDLMTHAFEIDLHNGELALELGMLARESGNADLAARAFRSVTFMKSVVPGSSEGATAAAKGVSYMYLGEMARERGDIRKARLLAQKALTEDPSLEQAKQLLTDLKVG